MRKRWSELLAFCALAVAGASCSANRSSESEFGGETHWLAACAADDECQSADLSCTCGTCTRACSGDAAGAGGGGAACVDTSSPLLVQRCKGRGASSLPAVCLASCTGNADCGRGRACVQHTCVPAAVPDAGAASPGADADAGLSISDFNSVSDSLSWADAVTVPAPQLAIAGADDRIIGTWNEVNCDVTQASSDPAPQERLDALHGCLSLSIERAASGEVTGSVAVHRPAFDPTRSPQFVNGPFSPPDPDVGYPIGVDPADYEQVMADMAGEARYRMLDAHFDGVTLTLAWSGYDLWHDWCQLQKSYPWEVGGHSLFFCAPQDEAGQAAIDRGKLALCTSPAFLPQSCPRRWSPLEPRVVGCGGKTRVVILKYEIDGASGRATLVAVAPKPHEGDDCLRNAVRRLCFRPFRAPRFMVMFPYKASHGRPTTVKAEGTITPSTPEAADCLLWDGTMTPVLQEAAATRRCAGCLGGSGADAVHTGPEALGSAVASAHVR